MKSLLSTKLLVGTLLSIVLLASSCTDSFLMDAFVKRFNKKCPIEAGSISFNFAEVIASDTIGIDVSFTHHLNDTEVYFQKEILPKTMLGPTLLMLKEKQYNTMKKKNVNFLYRYYTLEGEHIVDITITPEQYNQPIENFRKESELTGVLAEMERTASSIREQLPLESPETGLTIVDCKFVDSTLITVNRIPNHFVDVVFKRIDKENIPSLFLIEMLENTPLKKTVLQNGIKVRHVYLLESSDTLCVVNVNKEDYEKDYSKIASVEDRIEYCINTSIHNVNRAIQNPTDTINEVYLRSCRFENNRLTTEFTVPSALLDSSEIDFDIVRENILEEALNDEINSSFLLKQGFKFTFVYFDEEGNQLSSINIVEKDLLQYKKQRYENNEIQKY